MKFLYVDESGNGNKDPYLVFFGLQVDAYKLKKAMRDARPLLAAVSDAFPEELRELKSSRMVNGRGGWRKVAPNLRKDLFHRLCRYVSQVSATGFAFVIERAKYDASSCPPVWASTPWLTGAVTIAMFVQRQNQRIASNKGLTVMIFDDNKFELPKLSNFLIESCRDVDEYYERSSKAEPFDHIVDTAFAIKSEHSRLVQVSDACAYAIRRRAEIELGKTNQEWDGELAFIKNAFRGFSSRICYPTKTWTGSPWCAAVCWIREVGIPDFKKWMES